MNNEPVAWMDKETGCFVYSQYDYEDLDEYGKDGLIPLYTAEQLHPAKTLTDEELVAHVPLFAWEVFSSSLFMLEDNEITNDEFIKHAQALYDIGVKIILVDTANGHGQYAVNAVKELRGAFDDVHIMAGNVATADGFAHLAQAGADSVRVGIGGGSACTTRIVSGHGVPTLTSIMDCDSWREQFNSTGCSIIADGGIRNSGDMVKSFAAGADVVMIGSMLAGTDESPGDIFVDASANIYQNNYTSSPTTVQVVKLNNTAVLQWQKSLASANPSYPGTEPHGVVADSSGNVYVLLVSAATGVNNIYIAKYNSSGTLQWQKQYGDSSSGSYVAGSGLAIDNEGNPHFVTANIGNRMGAVKLNPSGAIIWQTFNDIGPGMFDPGGNSQADVIAIGAGNIPFIAGYLYAGEFTLTLVRLSPTAGFGASAMRITDPAGYFFSAWARGIASNASGDIYLASQGNGNTCYVIKVSLDMVFQWNRKLSISGGNTVPRGIAVDASGNSYTLGGNAGLVYVAKYNSSGTLQWQRSFVSTSIYPVSITLNAAGTIYYINCQFDAAGTSFYAKLPTDGSKTGTYTVNGQTVTYAASSLTDSAYTLNNFSPGRSSGTISLPISNSSLTQGTPTKSNAVTNL